MMRFVLWGLIVLVAVGTFLIWVPLPRLFAYSDAVISGTLACALYLGGVMMWPSQWLWSTAQRALYTLTRLMGVAPDRAQMALKVYADAETTADRLRKADNGFADDLSQAVARAANQIDRLGLSVLQDAGKTRAALPLITRADLLAQAAEGHAALRRKTKNEGQIASARSKLADAIASFENAVATHDDRAIAAQLTDIQATTKVAKSLFNAMEGPRT